MATFTPEQRLARARMSIMSHKTWCLYTGLLLIGKLEIKKLPMPTAATNGRDVWVDPRFIETLDDASLRFTLLHENEHKALRQMDTYAFLWDKNAKLANIAADFVVNLRILDADNGENFITMPKTPEGKPMGAYDTKYRGWTTKQVFDDLMQKQQQKQGKGQGGQRGKSLSGEGEGGEQGFDEHQVDGTESLTPEEKEALKSEIEAAIRQGGLLAGKMGGNSSKLLEDALDSQIRWQEILAEFVKSFTKGRDDGSWSKMNRRFIGQGLYLPGTISGRIGGLFIGGDASGSTWSGNQLEGFLGETIAICNDCQPDFVDFVWWDTKIQVVHTFTPDTYGTMIEVIKNIQGGGGTTPSCVTDWIKKQSSKREYVAAIMLSDGQVGNDWGEWDNAGVGGGALPVLWCLNTRGITSPVGQTLHIEEA